MPLTANSSIFSSLHEKGINLVIQHIMRKRPSYFNYGTELFATNPNLLCNPINPHPWVTQRNNPLISVEDPIPLLGTNGFLGVDFCIQITEIRFDFFPSNVVALPPELHPLANQRFALQTKVCAGLSCRKKERLAALPKQDLKRGMERKSILLPMDSLACFCLDLYAVCHFEIDAQPNTQRLVGKLDGLEIVDIKPNGLEQSIECYLSSLIQLVMFPKLSILLETLTFQIPLNITNASVAISATPVSANIPFNPAIEDDQVKLFINVQVI